MTSTDSATTKATTLTDLLVPTYKQNLNSALKWLEKIEESQVEVMLSNRLAPDMFPLATQLRFIAYQAQEAVYRVQGKDIPESVLQVAQEGRSLGAAATESTSGESTIVDDTLGAAKARIQEALIFLESLEPDALDQNGSAERILSLELTDAGVAFDLTGEQFVRDWAIPQFYFHTVAAYSIMRNAGVELGKADYVPHMFAYLRSPAPSASKE